MTSTLDPVLASGGLVASTSAGRRGRFILATSLLFYVAGLINLDAAIGRSRAAVAIGANANYFADLTDPKHR